MSEHCFGLYRGHLSRALIKRIEAQFPEVSVINYTEPRGERRGWFACPNQGDPFDRATASAVMAWARAHATNKRDREILGE